MAEKETYEALPAGRSLEELIDAQRANLMQVQVMARCLFDVLLYSDDDDGTMHDDVVKVLARLIAESVDALEKIVTRPGWRTWSATERSIGWRGSGSSASGGRVRGCARERHSRITEVAADQKRKSCLFRCARKARHAGAQVTRYDTSGAGSRARCF
jgi:hypothetical protein